MRVFSLVAGLLIAATAPLSAATLPSSGKLAFEVMRKGKDIGDHSYRFSGSPGAFSVTVATDVAVKVPLIRTTLYSFKHSSVETWKGDQLKGLNSQTNDDGTPHKLNIGATKLLPASLWNEDIVRSSKLVNTVDGKTMSVRVTDMGSETVPLKRGKITAHHYRLSGGLQRDLWFDPDGNLAHVSFTADDGSTVTYVRK